MTRYDLVAIGGGLSGLVTACRAAQLGQRAAVLEQGSDERYPCSSRWSTGVVNVMGLAILADPEQLYRAIIEGSGNTARPELACAIADNGKRAIDWLGAQGARFIQRGLQKDQPGQQVLAPPRRLQAGLDWEGRGADVLLRLLEKQLIERGGAVLRGTKAEMLIVENGACVGVEATRNGQRLRVDAKAVVIADGGFAANRDMIARFITPRADRVLSRVGPGAQGDGIRMAEAAGAAIGGFGKFYGHIHHANAMSNSQLWPYPHLDAAAEVAILVGPDGKRFADEGLGGVCMANAIAQLADPLSSQLIIDDAIWQAEPKLTNTVAANPTMANAGGPIVTAPDLAALATRIRVPADALAATVRAHNEAVAGGNFAALAVPRTQRKHRPMAIAQPPFHAVPLCAGITGSMGGVVIDAHAQASTSSGAPFPGLYAVGTPIAGLEGGPRAGYVGGLSKAFILGLVAAEHIAAS
ncbi:MAG TPA: FAD-dependent oxidoreductase [Stellaceae bacterium]|nr:FAD-dependent oxidoreductase [Stellaceae bacterium]